MCIERNRDILFGVRAKSRASRYVPNCRDMQLVLPNPTTLAIPARAGLVHVEISASVYRRFSPCCPSSNSQVLATQSQVTVSAVT
jgi:hypothetical protein